MNENNIRAHTTHDMANQKHIYVDLFFWNYKFMKYYNYVKND